MTANEFTSLIAEVTKHVGGRALDAALEDDLNRTFPPGSAHRPTVRGGKALVLYLLPAGAIEFTKEASP